MSRRSPTMLEKIRGLPWINTYSAMNSVFCQLTVFGSIFILFLNDLGFRKGKIGILLGLMPLCSTLSVLTAPHIARLGFKRSFMIFWGTRNVVIASLLATPWFISTFGPDGAFAIIAVVLVMFAVCRSVGEMAWYPWSHEVIPHLIRGKFAAVNNMLSTVASMLAILAAGWVLKLGTGLDRYLWLIGGGVVIGLVSVAAMGFVPGGAAQSSDTEEPFSLRRFRVPAGDRNFLFYLAGVGLVLLGNSLMAFVTLFLKDSIKLQESQVVFIQGGGMIGVLVSSYLWGWAADRYGSKPVMLLGLAAMVLTPLLWFLLPPGSSWSMPLAVAISAASGLAGLGYGIGSARLLYTDVVPQAGRTEYFSMYCAWCGLLNGLGPLLAGQILNLTAGLRGPAVWPHLDAYTPLFGASMLLLGIGAITLSKTRSDSTLTTIEFAGMFFRGNPLMALGSKLRYSLALEESDRVMLTQRLSRSGSSLSTDELVEALNDPSFNVRQEAILTATQMPPDFRLIEAIWRVAEGNHPDGQAAAKALSRVGRVSRNRNVRQLIDALHDGNADARYEAVIGLSHVRPEPAVVEALARVAESPQTELAMAAVWALSRLGGPHAVAACRKALDSDRPALAARAARALGTLADHTVLPVLLDRFRSLDDVTLRLAYASALGTLRSPEPVTDMLRLLPTLQEEISRTELSLAIARIVGGERNFTRLWRKARRDIATTLSATMLRCRKRLRRKAPDNTLLHSTLDACIESFANDNLPTAATQLQSALTMTNMSSPDDATSIILQGCRELLRADNPALRESLILSVHVLSESIDGIERRR